MELVFQECVREAKAAGKSVLLSSHILSEVEKLCDRVSIIRRGRIIESGSLDELRHLTRTKVRVQTAKPIPNLNDIPGVHDVEEFPGGFTFQVDSPRLGRLSVTSAAARSLPLKARHLLWKSSSSTTTSERGERVVQVVCQHAGFSGPYLAARPHSNPHLGSVHRLLVCSLSRDASQLVSPWTRAGDHCPNLCQSRPHLHVEGYGLDNYHMGALWPIRCCCLPQ